VSREFWGVVWYRFRVTFRRRWAGYLAIVLLIGSMGGIAMGALAAARRTQSSFPAFLQSTNPSDISVAILGGSDDPRLIRALAHLPHVRRVERAAFPNQFQLGPNGAPINTNVQEVAWIGSVDGEFFDQDRAAVTRGRMADPRRADEIVMSADAARVLRLHVGDVVPLGFYTNAQTDLPGFATARVPPHFRIDTKLVGIVAFNNTVVQDDIDRYPTLALFTPTLTHRIEQCPTSCLAGYSVAGIQLAGGARDVPAAEAAMQRVLPQGYPPDFHLTSTVAAQAERSIKPEAIALGVFGAIAALATVLIAGQVISRQLRVTAGDLDVLRGLGADPAMNAIDGLIGIVGSIVVGSLLACGVAVGLSPLAPIGPARSVDPTPGIAFDWTVLGVGVVGLIVVLTALAGVLASRQTPPRAARRDRRRGARGSSTARAATAAGLPTPAVAGIRFALEPGRDGRAVPVRSALVGTALAVALVVATVTFGSSLDTLVSHPALYGWNWTYALQARNGGPIPPQTQASLTRDPNVAAWTGLGFAALVDIDGKPVPALRGDAHAAVTPLILSGHALDGPDEVVLGAGTLAQLHKRVGDTVRVSYGLPKNAPLFVPPTPARVVGTATMPTIGTFGTQHTSMSRGALLSTTAKVRALDEAQRNDQKEFYGPPVALVRLRNDVPPQAGRAALQRIADAMNRNRAYANPNSSWSIDVLSVQRPAEIVNYRSMGTTPAILTAGLAGAAIVALGLTLAASVRRRRRDLALLKTLGFTHRQLGATVAAQASVAALVGTLVGIPIGIVAGRWLWTLFANDISAVTRPTVPPTTVVLIAVGTLVLANLVAAIPGRQAARTPAALLLQEE